MITDSIPMTGVATTRSPSFNRIAAISGLAFVLCVVTSLVLVGDVPKASDDVTTLRAYFTESPGSHQAGLLLIGLSIVPAFLFLAGLVGIHRDADRAHGEQRTVAIVGFLVFANALNAVGQAIDGARPPDLPRVHRLGHCRQRPAVPRRVRLAARAAGRASARSTSSGPSAASRSGGRGCVTRET